MVKTCAPLFILIMSCEIRLIIKSLLNLDKCTTLKCLMHYNVCWIDHFINSYCGKVTKFLMKYKCVVQSHLLSIHICFHYFNNEIQIKIESKILFLKLLFQHSMNQPKWDFLYAWNTLYLYFLLYVLGRYLYTFIDIW